MKRYFFDVVSSTNDFAETIRPLKEDAVIVAKEQTGGHGSKGRSFISSKGGLYLTSLKFYEDFPASRVFEIMITAALAVCKTLEEFSLAPVIKWPNDVYVGGKKICGILINNTFAGGLIASSVVGIGINIENAFSGELKDIAVNMKEAGAVGYSFDRVSESLIRRLEERYTVEEYKRYIPFFGKEILLTENGVPQKAVALDVDGQGRLVVEQGGKIRQVTAAEVSLRLT